MAITRDQFVTGLVWRWANNHEVIFLTLEPTQLPNNVGLHGCHRIWWQSRDTEARETPYWKPEEHQLDRMEPAPHTPETLIRWIKHLKETEDARAD